MGTRPVRRWDSWYDPQLTIHQGENILADLDNWAVAELRKHKLIWTGWKAGHFPRDELTLISGTVWGVRKIEGINPGRLRLFFLSLLWRAAATMRPEFSAATLPAEDLEQLRQMLVSGNPGPLAFYPAQLTQLYTRGEIHNHVPIADTKVIPAYGTTPERHMPIFRFYFDGLVAHIHRHATDSGYTADLGPLTVGDGNTLIVSALPYEKSFQSAILREIQQQATATWPDALENLI